MPETICGLLHIGVGQVLLSSLRQPRDFSQSVATAHESSIASRCRESSADEEHQGLNSSAQAAGDMEWDLDMVDNAQTAHPAARGGRPRIDNCSVEELHA